MSNGFSAKHNSYNDFASDLQSVFDKVVPLAHRGKFDEVTEFHDNELKAAFRDILDAQTNRKLDHSAGEELYEFFSNLEKQLLSNDTLEKHRSMKAWNKESLSRALDFHGKRLGY